MDGGTTFHFVTDGIDDGATTINQDLAAGLVDELRVHIVPLTGTPGHTGPYTYL